MTRVLVMQEPKYPALVRVFDSPAAFLAAYDKDYREQADAQERTRLEEEYATAAAEAWATTEVPQDLGDGDTLTSVEVEEVVE